MYINYYTDLLTKYYHFNFTILPFYQFTVWILCLGSLIRYIIFVPSLTTDMTFNSHLVSGEWVPPKTDII